MKNNNNYELYTNAAAVIEWGWTQRGYQFGNSYCLAGALGHVGARGGYSRSRQLQGPVLDDVHQRLRRYPSYWIGRLVSFERTVTSRQAGLEFWNDCPWRRKKTVIKVLKNIAKTYEPVHIEALVDDRNQLAIEVTNLRSQVTTLRERVTTLEHENTHLWNRLFNTRSLETDQADLAALETELETKWRQLQKLDA